MASYRRGYTGYRGIGYGGAQHYSGFYRGHQRHHYRGLQSQIIYRRGQRLLRPKIEDKIKLVVTPNKGRPLNNDVIESERSVPVSQIADNEVGENPTVTHDFSVQIDFGETLPKVISEDTETIKENTATVSTTQQKLIQQINVQRKKELEQIDNILNNVEDETLEQQSPPLLSLPKFPPRLPVKPDTSLSPIVEPEVQTTVSIEPIVTAELGPAVPAVPAVPIAPAEQILHALPTPKSEVPVIPQAVPAVPGRPVVVDKKVLPVQTTPAGQPKFIPMPVPAVPSVSR